MALEASEDFATRFVAGIPSRFDPVLQFPLSGGSRPQFAPERRVIFQSNDAIYYLPRQEEIVIVRGFDGSRDIEAVNWMTR